MQRTLIKAIVIGITFLFYIATNDNVIGIKQHNQLRSKASGVSQYRLVAEEVDAATNNTIPAGEDFPSVRIH